MPRSSADRPTCWSGRPGLLSEQGADVERVVDRLYAAAKAVWKAEKAATTHRRWSLNDPSRSTHYSRAAVTRSFGRWLRPASR